MRKILVITDTKKSSINQCNALIDNYSKRKKTKINYQRIEKKSIHFLPNFFIYYYLVIKSFIKINLDFDYDLIVSCGRISAPYSLLYKKFLKCKNIHILDPYLFRNRFDVIIIPSHDNVEPSNSKNIVQITGTFVLKKKLSRDSINKFSKLFKKKKIVSCFIGGDGKSSKFSKQNVINCVSRINNIDDKFCIVYCFSRRTSTMIKNTIKLKKKNRHLIFDYDEINPYWYLIEKSEFFIVSEDSVSMISDTISSGKPVYIQKIDFVKRKIRYFVQILQKRGFVRYYSGKLDIWRYEPLNESLRVSKIIERLI